MAKYILPAEDGRITVELNLPKGVKIKSWHSYGNVVVVETNKEVEGLKDYKI